MASREVWDVRRRRNVAFDETEEKKKSESPEGKERPFNDIVGKNVNI